MDNTILSPLTPSHLQNGRHHLDSLDLSPATKRALPQSSADEQSSKRLRTSPEEPSLYSDNVRRKLAATTRTGQACDRCKERKMKCDPDPIACQPCRQKNLKCYTTDRVSGLPRERGQSERVDGELTQIRDQLAEYQRRYGPLSAHRNPSISPQVPASSLLPHQLSHMQIQAQSQPDLPSPRYVGWAGRGQQDSIHRGPVEGTRANILDWGTIDSSNFDCETMREPMNDNIEVYNFSTTSVLKSIYQRQKIRIDDLHLPTRAEALEMASTFLSVMWAYYPVVHKVAFPDLICRFYDTPDQITLPEKIQVVQMLGVLNHQFAIRNQATAEKMKDAQRYFHFSLGHYPDLIKDSSLSAMQALAMLLLQFRNMPKPGYTWNLAQDLLQRCIELDYHRDPDKIVIPPDQCNPQAKEMRKRVFHGILGICVTTGCRLGRPAPWQFIQWDVPLPMQLLDDELTVKGISPKLSGRCDFWGAIHLAKLLPLYTELHNHILSVRKSPEDYTRTVEILHAKLDAWRAEWDTCTVNEDKTIYHWAISTLLIDTWAAEFVTYLRHPSLCTVSDSDYVERNLEECHKATKRMLGNCHKLSKTYKASDFTWHSTVAYTIAFGLTLHIHLRKSGLMTQERFDAVKNELAGWISAMRYADLVLATGDMLVKHFSPIVKKVQSELASRVIPATQPDNIVTRNSLSAISAPVASRSNSIVKQEHSPYPLVNGHASPGLANGHATPTPSPQTFQEPNWNYSNGRNSIVSTIYSMYPHASTTLPYVPLPTSLAPLLNEAPPTSTSPYPHPIIAVNDPAMAFAPHLYTDRSAVWPLAPETS